MRQIIFAEFNRNKMPIFLGAIGCILTLVMTVFISVFREGSAAFITFIVLGGVSLGVLGLAFLFHMVYSMGALNSLWNAKNDYIRSSPISPFSRIIGMMSYHLISGVLYVAVILIASLVYSSAISEINILIKSIDYFKDILEGFLSFAILLIMLYGACWGATAVARRNNFSPVAAMTFAVIVSLSLVSALQWIPIINLNYIAVYSDNGLNVQSSIIMFFIGLIGILTATIMFDPFETVTPIRRKRYTTTYAMFVIAPVILVVAVNLIGNFANGIKNGEIVTKQIGSNEPATEIVFESGNNRTNQLATAVTLTLVPGDSTLTITTNEWAQEQFKIKQDGGRIEITQNAVLPKGVECDIRIGVGTLSSIELDGFVNVNGEGDINCGTLSLISSGVSNIVFGIKSAEAVSIESSGVGTIELSGETNTLDLRNDGVGKVLLKTLKAANVSVYSDGVGTCEVWATETLNATLSGVGSILYRGDPVTSNNVNGLGKISKMED